MKVSLFNNKNNKRVYTIKITAIINENATATEQWKKCTVQLRENNLTFAKYLLIIR